jgi:glutamine amidotransferase
MHNGVISNFLDIKRDMLDEIEKEAYENIHGSTDSEHFAALYMTYLARLEHVQGKASWSNCDYSCSEMREALIQAVKTVISLQQKSLGQKAQANSLNVAVTDGKKMVAIRFRNHELEQPPSLYWSTEAGKRSHVREILYTLITIGVTLNRKYPELPDGQINPVAYKDPSQHASHVIIASEPSTYKHEQWNLIPKNKSLSVDEDGVVEIMSVEMMASLMATATTTEHA